MGKTKEIKEKLLQNHAGKPTEWWATQLANARAACMGGYRSKMEYMQRLHDAECEAQALLSINRNMTILLNKMGIPVTTLRVTYAVEDWPNGTVCDGCEECCDDCEEIEVYDKTELLRVYDYCILGEVLDAITCEFKSKRVNASKIVDITNPKNPIVLFEADEDAGGQYP